MFRLNSAGFGRAPWEGGVLTKTAGRPFLAVRGWDVVSVREATEDAWRSFRAAVTLETYRDHFVPLLNTLSRQWTQASVGIPRTMLTTRRLSPKEVA